MQQKSHTSSKFRQANRTQEKVELQRTALMGFPPARMPGFSPNRGLSVPQVCKCRHILPSPVAPILFGRCGVSCPTHKWTIAKGKSSIIWRTLSTQPHSYLPAYSCSSPKPPTPSYHSLHQHHSASTRRRSSQQDFRPRY